MILKEKILPSLLLLIGVCFLPGSHAFQVNTALTARVTPAKTTSSLNVMPLHVVSASATTGQAFRAAGQAMAELFTAGCIGSITVNKGFLL